MTAPHPKEAASIVTHTVRPQPAGRTTPKQEQLAWHIAALASRPARLDGQAVEMAVNRIIENTAVALAAINRAPVCAARAQALCFPREGGANILGLPQGRLVDCGWAAWANATAVRELDFHDSFFSRDSSHPGDTIAPLIAVAQQCELPGEDLLRGILVAYEIQVGLVKGIALNPYRIDHVAHLGPAVAAGLGAMLRLPAEIIYQAVQQAAHVSIGTRQARKGTISSWKACAPGHVGKAAIEAIDRAMRGETSPSPIWEGDYGIIAVLLGGPDQVCHVPLPGPGSPCRAILETYPKEHSAGYHGQAIIDLAFRMRPNVADLDHIERIELRTKRLTHVVMGAGSGDPEKWDPAATRETLDHSAMFQFARALVDGEWHHERSYDPARIADPAFVALWRKVVTVEDDEWNRRFDDPPPLEKDHGARAVITYEDGRVMEDELPVANCHPRGARPWTRADYERKLCLLTEDLATESERERFLDVAHGLANLPAGELRSLTITLPANRVADGPRGLFDRIGDNSSV